MIQARMVYPYFENPEMLERQIDNWNQYAGDLRRNIKLIIVDDHSTYHPAKPILEKCKLGKSLFRFTEPGLWTQHEARNLGAKNAGKEPGMWLFMSDIDLMLTAEMAFNLFDRELNAAHHYTFDRVEAPLFSPKEYHCNSFLTTREAYWRVNGYDVDFCGLYGGGYGGDGAFTRQLDVLCPREHLTDVQLIHYGRSYVADASTTLWDRAEWNQKYRERFNEKRKTGDMRSKNPIRRKWERLL